MITTDAPKAKIGPNALIQTVQALQALTGPAATFAVLAHADRLDLLDTLPSVLVSAHEFTTLVEAVYATLPQALAEDVLAESGARTAAYVIRNRIPAPVRGLLRLLPPALAIRVLLQAIARHTYTFAGAAEFSYRLRPTPVLRLAGDPATGKHVACAVGPYYHGAFQAFMHDLVSPHAHVSASAAADGANLFTVRW